MTLQDKVNRLEAIGLTWMGPDEKYFLSGQYVDIPDIDVLTDEQFEGLVQQIIPMVPTVIDKAMDEFKSGSQILRDHEARASKAVYIGNKLLDAWIAADAITDQDAKFKRYAELDKSSNAYMVNCRVAVGEMKEARAIISQLMGRILEKFTTEENAIDSQSKAVNVPKRVQERRNRYATDRLLEEKRLKKEAEDKLAKQKEAVDLRAALLGQIGSALIAYQAKVKGLWLASFNSITLENYNAKNDGLAMLSTAFPSKQLETIVVITFPITFHHKPEEKEAIKKEVWDGYDFFTFQMKFGQEMADYKKELQDKLPSKKAELDEAKQIADKAEADRLAQVELDRLAEVKRQEDLKVATDEKEKADLLKKQEKERQDEKDKLDKIEKDRLRAEKDLVDKQKERELQEQLDLNKQQEQAQQQNNSRVELGRTAGHAQSLFEMQNTLSSGAQAPAANKSFEIEVHNMIGWVEIFTRFVELETGEKPENRMSMDKWEKKTLGSMKKEIEAVAARASKEGKVDQIVSKNLTYKEVAKAINKKEKEEKDGK